MINFPAPVGGTPYPLDFAPSILFAVLYASVIPLMLHRVMNRRSRTVLLTGTAVFSVERIYVYTLRAIQSRNEKARLLSGFVTYMQLSFAMGFIGIASDMVNTVRCLIVNPTYGSEMYYQSPAAMTKGGVYSPPPAGTHDQPELRSSLRSLTSVLGLTFLGAYIPGVIAQVYYSAGFTDQTSADKSQRLRLVSSVVAISSCLSLITLVGWSSRRFYQNSKRAAAVASSVSALMGIVAVYRVSVMGIKISSLKEPFSLNEPGAKAAFYIFHALPEWLAVIVLFGVNVRKLFGTGPMGDYRLRDMTEKQKQKWEKKQAIKRQETKLKQGSSLELPDEVPMQEKGMVRSDSETIPPPLVKGV